MEKPAIDDKELLQRFIQGDDSAFEELYDKYAKPVFQYLIRLCGDRNLSDEIHQSLFVKVARTPEAFAAAQSFKPYLFAAAHKEFLTWKRKEENRQNTSHTHRPFYLDISTSKKDLTSQPSKTA